LKARQHILILTDSAEPADNNVPKNGLRISDRGGWGKGGLSEIAKVDGHRGRTDVYGNAPGI
jgi:hypothetical protein